MARYARRGSSLILTAGRPMVASIRFSPLLDLRTQMGAFCSNLILLGNCGATTSSSEFRLQCSGRDPDQVILDSHATKRGNPYGVRGRVNIINAGHALTVRENRNGNDGTIARFGWKAQNKSLLVFAGEAYNVEMGISNELFQTEREEDPKCQFKPTPNDTTNPDQTGLDVLSDIEKFAAFMRFLAPPMPSQDEPGGADSISRGKRLFIETGCALCHTPSLRTGT